MQKLHLVGFTKDHDGLILSARRGSRSGGYLITVDAALEEAVEEARARRDEAEAEAEPERPPRIESTLSVKEIQARLRQGRSVADVAKAAGVEPAWVERFAPPVLAERAQVIIRVRQATLARARLGPSRLAIGDAVRHNLADRGVAMTAEEFDDAWTARQVAEGRWVIRFKFHYRAKDQQLQFDLDESSGEVTPAAGSSGQLAYIAPAKAPAKPKPIPDRPIVKRAEVGRGMRTGAAKKATSRSAKEREKATAALAKAAAKRAVDAEKAAVRRAREKVAEAARKEREAKAEALRREREAKAEAARKAKEKRAAEAAKKQREAERARAAKAAAAEKAAAKKARDAEKAAAKKAATKKTTMKQAAAKKTAAKKTTAAKQAAAKQAVGKKAVKKQTVAPKRAAKRPVAKAASPLKAATPKPAAEKHAAGKTVVANRPPVPGPAAHSDRPRTVTEPVAKQSTPREPAGPAPTAGPTSTGSPATPAAEPSARAASSALAERVDRDGDTGTGASLPAGERPAARPQFRSGLVERAAGDTPAIAADAPRDHSNGTAPLRRPPDRPRRTRPLRAT